MTVKPSVGSLEAFGAPLARSTPVAEVASRILSQLSSGQLSPGSRLPSERQLAEALKVGRSTVREAIAALDLLGVIETRQGAGSYIRGEASDLLPQTIEWGLMLGRPRTLDLVETRRHIEIVNAGLAAQRSSAEGHERLVRVYADMVSSAKDSKAFVEVDVAFHLEIASLAENSVLSDILTSIRSLLHVWVTRAAAGQESTGDTLEEHRLVMEAVLSGDPEQARHAMEHHMDCAGARLTRSIDAEAKNQGRDS
jgi:DNA-binding FadR family transcriptional regulator